MGGGWDLSLDGFANRQEWFAMRSIVGWLAILVWQSTMVQIVLPAFCKGIIKRVNPNPPRAVTFQ
jgi:hypothetical protein